MSLLNVSEAARATGKHRVTIQKHIKHGKISVSRDDAGNPKIDVAELIRVYGPLKTDGNTDSTAQVIVQQQQTTAQAETIEVLKEQLRLASEREQQLLAMLEREQELNKELQIKMLPVGKDLSERGKGFWAKLFG